MPIQYPIRAAAKLTGIAVDTLRAWERRYRAVTPMRSARGRLYSDADVRRLLLLRAAVDGGHAIGQVASLSDAELQEVSRASFPSPATGRSQAQPGTASLELRPMLEAIESFDYDATNRELGRLALLTSPTELVHGVVLPLMRLTGENWENGTYQIAQEHMLSACVRHLLGGLLRQKGPANGAPRLLLTTPSSELHEFGILAAAMLALAHEFHVAYLGPNLPTVEILSAAARFSPQAVAMGIMKTNVTFAVRQDMERLASELSGDAELWIGGSGAASAADGIGRRRLLILEDLVDFERHLTRLKTAHSPEVAR